MRKWFLAVLAVAVFLPAAAQESKVYESYIQVTGRAEKEVEPDEFYMAITIAESDSKGKISVEQQQKEMIRTLKALGVDTEKQLKVENLTSEFMRKRGGMATANYELKLSAAADVARVWQALDRQGISEVSISRVSYSKIESLKEQVRAEAIRNARSSARTLAEAIDQKVGKCFYIYDSNSDFGISNYSPVMVRVMKEAMYDTAEEVVAEPELDFKAIKLQYSVQTKFVLE